MAIVTVSAFSLVLLKQIIETISFKRQRNDTVIRRPSIDPEVRKLEKKPLTEQMIELVALFGRELAAQNRSPKSEAEFLGSFAGFIA
ncbi:MAG TPA: hypothetical protein VK708_11870, partial [Bryobacteraceae bacterium]|nr:hypothetical protein [Bryobacteraceae bacterium]